MNLTEKIYLSPPFLTGREVEMLQAGVESNWIAPAGPQLDQFEKALSQFTKSNFCMCTVTGTAAIHLALIALGVTKGDIVIVPTFTFAATVNAVLYQGAIPVFVESEPVTWGMCPDTLRNTLMHLKKNQRPKAIIIVHPYGNSANITALSHVASEFELPLIEDASAALGTTFNHQQVGTFGALGVFSFNGNKIITTSQGGALVASEGRWIDKSRHVSAQSKIIGDGFDHDGIGYNYRMSNLLAAVGLAQMETMEYRISRKRAIFDMYQSLLKEIPVHFLPELDGSKSNRWLTNVIFDNEKDVTTVAAKMQKDTIEYRRLWKPMHLQTYCKDFPYFGNQLSVDIYKKGLSIPSGIGITSAEIERVVTAFKQ